MFGWLHCWPSQEGWAKNTYFDVYLSLKKTVTAADMLAWLPASFNTRTTFLSCFRAPSNHVKTISQIILLSSVRDIQNNPISLRKTKVFLVDRSQIRTKHRERGWGTILWVYWSRTLWTWSHSRCGSDDSVCSSLGLWSATRADLHGRAMKWPTERSAGKVLKPGELLPLNRSEIKDMNCNT